MKLHELALGVAASIVSGLSYTVHAALFRFAKPFASSLESKSLMIKDSKVIENLIQVDAKDFFLGLVIVVFGTFVMAWLLAYIYNKLIERYKEMHQR